MVGWLLGLRVELRDEQAAAAVTPAGIVGYLADRGWQHRRQLVTTGLWSHPHRPGRLLVAPGASQQPDYGRRVLHLVADLAEAEQRSQLAVLADLLGSR